MLSRAALLTLFWLSGAAGLALEVVWLRRLHLLFGGTALAVAAVTAAFMAGLGLGSLLAARRGDHSTRPLWWYGVLEIGIGLYALAIPALLELALPVYAVFGGWFAGMPLLLDAVRFGLAFLVLAPVTTAMGATLPLLVRQLSASGGVGINTGVLYAANTFGALAGVCLAGYWLLPALGERATTFLAASIDGAVGIGAVCWALRSHPLVPAQPVQAEVAPPPDHRLILAVVGVTGFASLACQVAWTRLIAMLLGSSVYAFTCIVAAVLAGISLGSAVSRWLPDRWAKGRTAALGGAALLAALGVLAGSACVNRLPWTIYDLVLRAGPNGYWLVQLGIAGLLILPAAVCFGAAPPLAIRALDPDPQSASRWVGRAWAANTVGALAGAGLGGLILVPWLGMQATLSFGAWCVVIAAVAAIVRLPLGKPVAAAGLIATVVLWAVPPAWSPTLLISQPYVLAGGVESESEMFTDAAEYAGYQGEALHRPLFHREGSSATVTVTETPEHLVLQVRWTANPTPPPSRTWTRSSSWPTSPCCSTPGRSRSW
ncbi:MAG: fused MFS/spermidine synthase [Planctomycetota bacterium]